MKQQTVLLVTSPNSAIQCRRTARYCVSLCNTGPTCVLLCPIAITASRCNMCGYCTCIHCVILLSVPLNAVLCVYNYSTNMAISDAGTLGSAILKHEGELEAALQEYQQQRIPQTAKEVSCSLQPVPPAETPSLYFPLALTSSPLVCPMPTASQPTTFPTPCQTPSPPTFSDSPPLVLSLLPMHAPLFPPPPPPLGSALSCEPHAARLADLTRCTSFVMIANFKPIQQCAILPPADLLPAQATDAGFTPLHHKCSLYAAW